MKRLLATATAVASCGFFAITGQPPAPTAIYTTAQAEAGRTAYRSSCGKCHTNTLLGRKGEAGELPPVDSLPANMREVVEGAGGFVPPLAGADFLAEWGARTTRDLSTRVRVAVGGFPPADSDKETYLNLTAYFLQANGAPSGTSPLTPSTAVELRSIAKGASPQAKAENEPHGERVAGDRR